MPRFWLQDPARLPRPTKGKRPRLRRTPLFDLAAVQQAIRTGELGTGALLFETTDSAMDLAKLGWTPQDLLDFICILRPFNIKQAHDFHGAHWCRSSDGAWYACDAYACRCDPTTRTRLQAGPDVYVKFSIPDDGQGLLIIISAHD